MRVLLENIYDDNSLERKVDQTMYLSLPIMQLTKFPQLIFLKAQLCLWNVFLYAVCISVYFQSCRQLIFVFITKTKSKATTDRHCSFAVINLK